MGPPVSAARGVPVVVLRAGVVVCVQEGLDRDLGVLAAWVWASSRQGSPHAACWGVL